MNYSSTLYPDDMDEVEYVDICTLTITEAHLEAYYQIVEMRDKADAQGYNSFQASFYLCHLYAKVAQETGMDEDTINNIYKTDHERMLLNRGSIREPVVTLMMRAHRLEEPPEITDVDPDKQSTVGGEPTRNKPETQH